MKTNYKLLYLSLSGLLMFSSCSNEDLDKMNEGEMSEEFTIMASQGDFNVPESKSRTEVDRWYPGNQDGTKKGVQMLWSTGDKIGVYGEGNQNLNNEFTYNASATNIALFKGKLEWTLGRPYKIYTAYYPFYQGADETAIKATIPGKQTYESIHSIAQYDYKAFYSDGIVTDKGAEGYRTFQTTFVQLATLIRFVINDTDIKTWLTENGKELVDTDKLESITFTSTNNAITGDFTYNLKERSRNLVLPSSVTEANKKLTLTVTSTTQETLKNGSTFYVAYAVVAPIATDNLNLSFKYGNYTVKLKEIQNVALERGKVYNIGLNAKSLISATVEEPAKPVTPSGQTDGNEFQSGGDAI